MLGQPNSSTEFPPLEDFLDGISIYVIFLQNKNKMFFFIKIVKQV